MGAGHVGNRLDIGNIAGRIANGLGKNRRRFAIDQLFQVGRVVILGKTHLNPLLGQHMLKKRIRPAVEQRHRNDVIADFSQIQDRVVHGCGTGAQPQPANTALQGGNAFFQHIHRRVHDASINIARHREVK